MNELIKTTQLAIGYQGHPLIQGIDFRLAKGQICCLLGANGAGKSTFLRTLLGLQPAISGEIDYFGMSLKQWSKAELAQKIAYVPQAYHSLFAFSTLDMVLMGRSPYLKWYQTPSQQDKQIALQALASLQIEALALRQYTDLSGGEQNLVLIARAIVQNAALLIMDEPTSSLDFGNQIRVLEKIEALRSQNRSLILTTHHPQQADFLVRHFDSIVLLDKTQSPAFIQGDKSDLLNLEKLAKLYRISPQQLQQHIHFH